MKMTSTPFICLSNSLIPTDISPEIKSLSGASLCKDFLCSHLGEDCIDKLEELCELPSPTSRLSFKLVKPLEGYGFAQAVKNLSGGVVLYFSKTEDIFSVPIADESIESVSSADTPSPIHFLCSHSITDFAVLERICRRVASSDSQLLGGRRILVECRDFHTACVPLPTCTFSMLKAIFSLVCAVSRSAVSDILLFASCGEHSLEISVSADLAVIPPFIGSSDDILTLSTFLRGSRPFLRNALLYGSEPGIRLYYDISPRGTLSLTATNVHGIMPSAEFKFPKNLDDEYAVTKILSDILLSV